MDLFIPLVSYLETESIKYFIYVHDCNTDQMPDSYKLLEQLWKKFYFFIK